MDSAFHPGLVNPTWHAGLVSEARDSLVKLVDAVTTRAEPQVLLALIDEIMVRMEIQARQVQHLDYALESNRHIGAAVGILMGRYRVSEDQAMSILRRCSQGNHRKLRDVADDVLLTGDIPDSDKDLAPE